MSSGKEIRIEIDAGTIVLYGNEERQNAGIMFVPKGTNTEIDVVYVESTDDKKNPAEFDNHGPLNKIRVFEYSDVWDEDYQRDFIIDTDEAARSVTEAFQPESQKL